MQFQNNGSLEEGILELSLDEFKDAFATNNHRKKIFGLYENFLSLCTKELKEFRQYIDGSYTTKKNKPHDIDVAFFININEMRIKMDFLKSIKSDEGIIPIELDIHFEPYCEDMNNPFYQACQKRQSYWMEIFSKDYRGNSKGIVLLHHKEQDKC